MTRPTPTPTQIRALRQAMGLTQRELGEAIYLAGADPARHVRSLEAGDKTPSGPLVKCLELIAAQKRIKVPWR